MQSDMREVLRIATPTAAVGAIATLVGGLVVGGKGAIGAVVGCVVVILFMALGQLALQWVAKSMPHLFQGMGLLVYSVQLVLLLGLIMAIRNTSLRPPGLRPHAGRLGDHVDRHADRAARQEQDPVRRSRRGEREDPGRNRGEA